MSEIEKMYENAGFVQKRCKDYSCIVCDKNKDCNKYPPFTAEKQIKLIKFLLKNYDGVDINKKINRFNFLVDNGTFIGCHHNDKSFEESLAGVINKLWVNMPEEEKQQVRGILE